MPAKNKICGIYLISTPNKSCYVGSSINIYRRWYEHRYALKNCIHHSHRLQSAWNKYGDDLQFQILERCVESDLVSREQYWVDKLSPALNCATDINNVWTNPETRKKLESHYRTPEYRKFRSEVGSRIKTKIKVETSDGICFSSMKDAAEWYGIKTSGIRHLMSTQRAGKLGIRVKRCDESWIDVIPAREAAAKKMRGRKHSELAKQRMSAAAKGRVPKVDFKALRERNMVPVCASAGERERIWFRSIGHAANFICSIYPDKKLSTVYSKIVNVAAGRLRSAYRYSWRYAKHG